MLFVAGWGVLRRWGGESHVWEEEDEGEVVCVCLLWRSMAAMFVFPQGRNLALAFQAAESIGIKPSLVSVLPPEPPPLTPEELEKHTPGPHLVVHTEMQSSFPS